MTFGARISACPDWLRLGFLEAGCGWVPYLISKIEERLERVPPNERPVLPSRLLAQKQLFFQCGEEMTTRRDVELLGDDCLLWASDFPHEATRTDMRVLVKEFDAWRRGYAPLLDYAAGSSGPDVPDNANS